MPGGDSSVHAGPSATACKICGAAMDVTHQETILGKYIVSYHLCPRCEYWCTDEPTWLDEAYSDAIAATDTGLVLRNLLVERVLGAVLPQLFSTGPYVDWAGGHGLLVRMLRDAGFDFYWKDRYATNLFARGFDWPQTPERGPARLVTAIEVLEHAPNPVELLQECLAGSGADSIFLTQDLHSGGADHNWWYLSPVTGQHVSFFSAKTLGVMADRLQMRVLSTGTFHLFTREPISRSRFTLAVHSAKLPKRVFHRGRQPLTWADHHAVTRRLLDQGVS